MSSDSVSIHYAGTTYIQENRALLIISGLCAFSTASSFLMFPAMYTYYSRALKVPDTLRVDGVGRPHIIVIQGFIRFASFAFIPVIISTTAFYLLVSENLFSSQCIPMVQIFCCIL